MINKQQKNEFALRVYVKLSKEIRGKKRFIFVSQYNSDLLNSAETVFYYIFFIEKKKMLDIIIVQINHKSIEAHKDLSLNDGIVHKLLVFSII